MSIDKELYVNGDEKQYFLTEDNKILEVSQDQWTNLDDVRDISDLDHIASDYDEMLEQMGEDTYKEISKRALDKFIEENEGSVDVQNADIPGAPNVWEVVHRGTGETLLSDSISTNEKDAYRDTMSAYFANQVGINYEFDQVNTGWDRPENGLKDLLEYCADHNVDISDVFQYEEVKSHIDRDSELLIFATKNDAEKAGADISSMLDGSRELAQAYLDGEIYNAATYDKDGEELDSCSLFVGSNIENNGIEDNFGTAIKELGVYQSIEECIEDNEKEFEQKKSKNKNKER